jgi:dipeptidyl aminopeptidase/acylaminoacyl peptidase
MIRTGETGKTNHFRLSAIGAAVLASIVLVLVTVTTKPAEAAFPGGKGKIAFAKYQSQGPDDNSPSIWVMNGDGSGQTDVTTTTGNDTQPAWSADGMKIVHTCFRLLPSNEDICTMSQDGSNLVRITDDTGVFKDNSPAWSPDGTKIVFASTRNVNNLNPEGDFELWTMDSNGSNPVQLTLNNSFDGDPAWSPDGTKIAFTSDRDGDNEIFAMNTSGGSVSR